MKLYPESDSPDEAILEGTVQAHRIIREINLQGDYPKMILLTVRNKRDGVTMDDLRSVDEAREQRMMRGTADEFNE